jgi:hypothetical protein
MNSPEMAGSSVEKLHFYEKNPRPRERRLRGADKIRDKTFCRPHSGGK